MRALIVVAAIAAGALRADAYPQFQLSTGAARCSVCHYAPAGGGLVNGYGRDESADTISSGGNGGFLHGLWDPPSWLALGGDLRGALVVNNVGGDDQDEAEAVAFPMQVDLYARAEVHGFSLYASAGVGGAVREGSRFISREHYLMWRPKGVGPYARVGRFFAPYGLRLAEHPTYVRRFLGFNTLEETYNVSGGYVSNEWELHATAFTPDFIGDPVGFTGSGGAVYYERRFGEKAAAGAQTRVAVSSDELRAQGGVVGKYYLSGPKILLMLQTDLVYQRVDLDELGSESRLQLAAYLGASWMFKRGFMAQLMVERWDEDFAVKGVARDAVDVELSWFPTAHIEASLFGRLQVIGTGTGDGDPSQVLLLQVHYYL